MPDERTPSKVVPVLVAALVCDVAVMDPSTGKKSLIGVFDKLWAGTFPAARPMSLYMKLADAQGFYNISVHYIESKSGQVIMEVRGELTANDRLMATDAHLDFPPLPIPNPGRYEFRIFANEVYLGAAFIDARSRQELKSGEQS